MWHFLRIISILLCIAILILSAKVFNRLRGNEKISKKKAWKIRSLVALSIFIIVLLIGFQIILFTH